MIAKNHSVELNQLINLFNDEKYKEINGNYLLDCLEHDGYIFESQPRNYQFTSPILNEWWKRYADRTL
jgi:hypothetical protein